LSVGFEQDPEQGPGRCRGERGRLVRQHDADGSSAGAVTVRPAWWSARPCAGPARVRAGPRFGRVRAGCLSPSGDSLSCRVAGGRLCRAGHGVAASVPGSGWAACRSRSAARAAKAGLSSSKPQAVLAVDLCLVGRVRVPQNSQDVAERGDDGCDLLAGHWRPWWRRTRPGHEPGALGGGLGDPPGDVGQVLSPANGDR